MATIIVRASLVRSSSDLKRGGHAMSILQWLHGLRRLGHDAICVDFVDDLDASAAHAFETLVRQWWFPKSAALVSKSSLQPIAGMNSHDFMRTVDRAEAIIEIGAPMTREPVPLLEMVHPKILIDRDPVLTHLWVEEGNLDVRDVYGEQDHYFTFGCNVGSPECRVSTHGILWKPMWNPVVMDWWSPPGTGAQGRFTTVGSWWEGGYHDYQGRTVGPKADEWRAFMDLPSRAGESLEIALQIEPDDPDTKTLRAADWILVNPDDVADTPTHYRNYIRASAGEFSCAKGVYAQTDSGWFSDRSTCYLAAGNPVVVQATGFEKFLPVGKGLFSVRSVEEAADAIHAIRRDYAAHSRAAYAIAREHFDSDRCLARLLSSVGIPQPAQIA